MRTFLAASVLACALSACTNEPALVIEVTRVGAANPGDSIRVCAPGTTHQECTDLYYLFTATGHDRVAVRTELTEVWIYFDRGNENCIGLQVDLEHIARFAVEYGDDPLAPQATHDCPAEACTVRSCLDALP